MPDLSLLLHYSIERIRMTTETRQFAPDYNQDEKGWWLFPRDIELRKELYPQEVFEHPAKANLFLVREMAKYLTKPGDSVLDPFAGVGSQMISALDGRKVVLIELEPYFIDLLKGTVDTWRETKEIADVYIYQGDCRQVLEKLPFLVDAAIFSPPYSTTMASSGIRLESAVDKRVDKGWSSERANTTSGYATEQYTKSALNMSRLNPFFYSQAMDLFFKRLAARVAPDGRVCVISKDRIEGPRRIMLSEPVILRGRRHGLKLEEWLKWKPPSTIAKASATLALKTHGKIVNVVEDEDLLIFVKDK